MTTIVPEALRKEPWLETIKDPADLVTKHKELISYQGRSIALPAKDAKPEEWEKVYSKLRPENASLYETPHENWPKELPYDEKFEAGAREQFHKLGLTPGQARGLYEWYVGENIKALTDVQAKQATRYDEDFGKLETEWGSNFKKEFETAVKTLSYIINGDMNHPIVKWLDSTGENKNPVLIKFFNEIGKKFIGEDELRGEDTHVATEDEALEIDKKIAEMRGDPKGPYMDAQHPGHKIAVAEMKKLYDRKVAASQPTT